MTSNPVGKIAKKQSEGVRLLGRKKNCGR